jgi:hypothetical protein
MRYADVEYLGTMYRDAEFVNGKWYFEGLPGEVYSFTFQDRIKRLNDLQQTPRHKRSIAAPGGRLFGVKMR